MKVIECGAGHWDESDHGLDIPHGIETIDFRITGTGHERIEAAYAEGCRNSPGSHDLIAILWRALIEALLPVKFPESLIRPRTVKAWHGQPILHRICADGLLGAPESFRGLLDRQAHG